MKLKIKKSCITNSIEIDIVVRIYNLQKRIAWLTKTMKPFKSTLITAPLQEESLWFCLYGWNKEELLNSFFSSIVNWFFSNLLMSSLFCGLNFKRETKKNIIKVIINLISVKKNLNWVIFTSIAINFGQANIKKNKYICKI